MTGLQLSATRVTQPYAKGVQISAEQMAQLRWLPSPTLPQWNYEIHPQEAAPASAHLPPGSEPAAG